MLPHDAPRIPGCLSDAKSHIKQASVNRIAASRLAIRKQRKHQEIHSVGHEMHENATASVTACHNQLQSLSCASAY